MEIKDRILKTERVDWRIIKDLQPENLKEKDNHTFLKDSLKKYGFSKAFDVWQDPITEQIYFCDGHSRAYILKELEQEGYEIPTFLTCNFLNVNTEKEAIQVLIEVHSQKQNAINLEVLEVWCDANDIEVNVESVNVVLQDSIVDKEETILEAKEDDFDTTPPSQPITVLGDLYEIGEHRLLCGDSTDSDQVARLMNGQKADMVFTDPPYNMQMKGGCVGEVAKNMRKVEKDIEFISTFNPTEFLNTLPIVFENKKMNAYVFCNKDLVPQYLNFAVENKYSFNILFWKKPNAIPLGDSHYPDVEYLLLFRKSAIWNNSLKDVNYSRCLEFGRESGLHPTMKPIELITNEMKISSNQNSLVVDFFLGSGSTMVASHQLKRKCYGVELDPKYCDVIVKRMIKLDDTLTIKRNGIDCTNEFKEL